MTVPAASPAEPRVAAGPRSDRAPVPVARKNTLLALLIDAIVAIVRFFKKGN